MLTSLKNALVHLRRKLIVVVEYSFGHLGIWKLLKFSPVEIFDQFVA